MAARKQTNLDESADWPLSLWAMHIESLGSGADLGHEVRGRQLFKQRLLPAWPALHP
jgi:hypothetical protein